MKFEALHCQIGHVEGFEHFLRGVGVVIGRAAHERETGERNHRIDNRLTPIHKESLYRGPRIEPRRKCGNDPQTPRFKRLDNRIVMGAVSRKRIGAHQQNTYRAGNRSLGGLAE